jgi:hypothetical protein
MSITKNTRLKFETTSSRLTPKQGKEDAAAAAAHETPINKGRKHTSLWLGDAQKIKLARNPRRRSTIADEMCLFVAPVASVAFSRQKVGNASDALPKDGSNLEQLRTQKKESSFPEN